MIRRPPRSTHCISSAASDVYKRQELKNQIDINNPDSKLTYAKYIEYCVELLLRGVHPLDYDKIEREQFKHFLKFCHHHAVVLSDNASTKARKNFDSKEKFVNPLLSHEGMAFDSKNNAVSSFGEGALHDNERKLIELAKEINYDKAENIKKTDKLSKAAFDSTKNRLGQVNSEESEELIFPLFGLNADYLKNMEGIISGDINSINKVYDDILNLLIENYPEARDHFKGVKNDTNEWLADDEKGKLHSEEIDLNCVNERNGLQRQSTEADINHTDSIFAHNIIEIDERLSEASEKDMKKIAEQNRLKALDKLNKLASRLIDNEYKKALGLKFIERLKEKSKECKVNRLASAIRKCLAKTVKAAIAFIKECADKSKLAQTKLKNLLLSKEDETRKKLLKKYFESWIHTMRANNESNRKKGSDDFMVNAESKNFASVATKPESSFKETLRDYLSADNFEQRVNSLIKTVSKMQQRCTKQLKENKSLNKMQGKLCSIDCTAKIPKYLQQKRLPLKVSANPIHRAKTLIHIANII
eukprot:TRINITY_DN18986_c0_g1_i1.p1 TRINITY_DN18986_c0_g1~~TRINITY_DN18986_c0_g1_i1.p1  ORF type:complete len:538 (-),score=92.57 TRINITY_DN18986_c0_g1_i1:123-1715(-)